MTENILGPYYKDNSFYVNYLIKLSEFHHTM
jgi:hypothetical protein